MVNKEHIENEVDKTLQSLEGIKRAQPNPYLFTRIMARMHKHNGWEKVTYFIARPVIAFAVLLFVIVINALVVFQFNRTSSNETEGIVINDIADEYNMVASTNYYETLGNEK